MPDQPQVTVFVRRGDPDCAAVLGYLEERRVAHAVRDIHADPGASAVLFHRLGRVVVPVVQVGERMVVGYDPVQLARMLPRPGDTGPSVSFGAAIRGVTEAVARASGLPAPWGVEVGRVVDGSPADAAGIRPGDVITEIGAYTLNGGADQFRTAVRARQPGDRMELQVWRAGEPRRVTVHFPASAEAPGEPAAPSHEA